MRKIIVSIHPEHVKNIINGTKKFEYRTKVAKSDVKKIIIYETAPIKKVVAEAEIIEVLMMKPEELWEETKEQSGISKSFFDSYFENRDVAYAYKLGEVKVYEQPKTLEEFGLRCAPQSFAYVR
ncbi:MAG: ASCH domain-containing protein [Bacilli bacterium]|nr:ASCH domain-containing protein [Bacilli bacterium]